MQLTRFEMEYFGEVQNVGMFVILNELSMREDTRKRLLEKFDKEMNIPNVDSLNINLNKSEEYIASFFTPKGLEYFKEDILKIRKYIASKNNGYKVVKELLNINDDDRDIVYKDEYQYLIKIKYKKK